jgi:hypothetical protein
MVIWAPETPSGVWTPTVRVGDIGGQLGGSGNTIVLIALPIQNTLRTFHIYCSV